MPKRVPKLQWCYFNPAPIPLTNHHSKIPYSVMRKFFSIVAIFFTTSILLSCSDSKEVKEQIATATVVGHERALELKEGAEILQDTMEIENLLLDVREREHRLRARGHDKVADAYIKSFLATLDSVNPSLATALK